VVLFFFLILALRFAFDCLDEISFFFDCFGGSDGRLGLRCSNQEEVSTRNWQQGFVLAVDCVRGSLESDHRSIDSYLFFRPMIWARVSRGKCNDRQHSVGWGTQGPDEHVSKFHEKQEMKTTCTLMIESIECLRPTRSRMNLIFLPVNELAFGSFRDGARMAALFRRMS